jgi:hypothetical protein
LAKSPKWSKISYLITDLCRVQVHSNSRTIWDSAGTGCQQVGHHKKPQLEL